MIVLEEMLLRSLNFCSADRLAVTLETRATVLEESPDLCAAHHLSLRRSNLLQRTSWQGLPAVARRASTIVRDLIHEENARVSLPRSAKSCEESCFRRS